LAHLPVARQVKGSIQSPATCRYSSLSYSDEAKQISPPYTDRALKKCNILFNKYAPEIKSTISSAEE
jgi:hypothetical protein